MKLRNIFLGVLLLGGAQACSNDDSSSTESSSSSSSASSSSGQGGSSSSQGGAGGSVGGAGGSQAGQGGSGGGQSACIDDYGDQISVETDAFCVVGVHTAPVSVGLDQTTFLTVIPTWGRHGGPLTMVQSTQDGAPIDEITVTRWLAPAGPSGSLSDTEEDITDLDIAVANPYINPRAVDAFGAFNIVGWATTSLAEGELLGVTGEGIIRVSIGGLFDVAVLGDDTLGRVLSSSLTAIEDDVGEGAGVYAFDLCDLEPCAEPLTIDTWGMANGPIVADSAGNVFAMQTNPSFLGGDDSEELRGFAAADIAPEQGSVVGNTVWGGSGFGQALAAIAPDGEGDGWVFHQPFDPSTFLPLDVIMQAYDGAAEAVGDSATAIATTHEVTLMQDGSDRLWVGVNNGDGSSSFYVLARR